MVVRVFSAIFASTMLHLGILNHQQWVISVQFVASAGRTAAPHSSPMMDILQ